MIGTNFDQYPLIQALQGINIGMDDKKDQNSSSSLLMRPMASYPSYLSNISNTSNSSSYSDVNNSSTLQTSSIANNINYDFHEYFEIDPQINIQKFIYNPDTSKPALREHVFVSKDCSRRLAQYIVPENWGKEYGLLYKYLDYIFRCQLFKKQVINIDNKYLIFHTGLQRRSDSNFLFAVLIPNKKHVQQKWRTYFGHLVKNSFLSKKEIISKFKYLIKQKKQINLSSLNINKNQIELTKNYLFQSILPERTKFCSNLHDLLFDATLPIEVDWVDRLNTNKDRVCSVLGLAQNTEKWRLKQLMYLFENALQKSKKKAKLNPRLAVAQGFVDTKRLTYRMELLLPLTIEYPKFSNKFYIFALALKRLTNKDVYTTSTSFNYNKSIHCNVNRNIKYVAKSILTMEMAYANARLVGYVDSSWLAPNNRGMFIGIPPTDNYNNYNINQINKNNKNNNNNKNNDNKKHFSSKIFPHITNTSNNQIYSATNNYVLY